MSIIIPEIDLHLTPKDCTHDILTDFIETAVNNGADTIRIIHGKGNSSKKLEVYKILEQNRSVYGYDDDGSNWGATVVHLEAKEK
ncbi:MAG TPA: Smr/MutS family protein [Spirochaetota bacterium]|nr:Smr/MutS family protein [Spirochaetota bacterium]